MRRERRYGSKEIKANPHDGIVEVMIPLPKQASKGTVKITPTAAWRTFGWDPNASLSSGRVAAGGPCPTESPKARAAERAGRRSRPCRGSKAASERQLSSEAG